MDGGGQIEIGDGVKYFGKLMGGATFVKVHKGGHKNILSYSTSNMSVNTMTHLYNWGGGGAQNYSRGSNEPFPCV